jgi:cell division protein FtsW
MTLLNPPVEELARARRRHPTMRPDRPSDPAVMKRRLRKAERRALERVSKRQQRARFRHLGVVAEGSSEPPLYWTLLSLICGLTLVGLVFVLSATQVRGLHKIGDGWYWFQRQTFFVLVGFMALALGSRVSQRFLRRAAVPFLGVAVLLLAVVLIPSPLSHSINGSRRWFGPEFVQFQPSEVAKLAIVLWLARLIAVRRDRVRSAGAIVGPAAIALGAVSLLIVMEPDLGTTVVIVAVAFLMLSLAGGRLDSLALISGPFALGAVFLAFKDYRWSRMLAFLDPWKSEVTTGYQVIQSRVGIASGGLFGVGLGNGRTKWGFLPEAHTDFIFSVIGEELGLIGCVAVLCAFVAFAICGMTVARRARDLESRLVAIGITCWITLQAAINMSVALGLVPNKGLTLPFVSYGGSSLVITLFAAGILLNIARHPAVRPPATAQRRFSLRPPSRPRRTIALPDRSRDADS